ncbi:MXAN_6640 family putative metalloprotease [Nocardioides bizhenqiangii]|uniref:MXAN_6640 family putative metalloprotease n=1 Tax=Nocardioides bizhenqiangii TaxID=3095076 RepID=A0ABZ0ZP47_9ACTN|nr:MXAN_6640 family putative metalloprotease [Nocardioides sp. HM61]WQQ25253.1 MXAN_6640 family putative metalloprotease [Nocardioides sp. HM61]
MSFPAHVAAACLLACVLTAVGGPAVVRADDQAHDPDQRHATDTPYSTLAMRDLFVARPRLGMLESLVANALLARPTDGEQDPGGDGYRGPSQKRCGKRICVHYAVRGADAPPSRRWVRRTLRVLGSVWDHEVGDLRFRPPPADRRRGGDSRFDVYLADVGRRGLFGYCTPERRLRGERFAASSYCVVDDDFARRQFGARPVDSLRVTIAHEFFHAIQFGYDFREDPWLLESTATWIEETFADRVDDNRRYLRFGTVHRPAVPLDDFSNDRYAHYGTWAWWEYLSDRHGGGLVRAVWRQADTVGDAPDHYSVDALEAVLQRHEGLPRALTSYAVANLWPADTYPEGSRWPAARVGRAVRLGQAQRSDAVRVRIDHLAARHLAFAPAGDLRSHRWRLRVTVDAPRRRAAARVTVVRSGGRRATHAVRLDRRGDAALTVRFDRRAVARVVVTLVNTSSRYRCGRRTMFACRGVPRDDDARFQVIARLIRR